MLSKEAYEQAHKEYPFDKIYPCKQENCNHIFSFVVYCNGSTDIVRCNKCGKEIETSCNFDDEYD